MADQIWNLVQCTSMFTAITACRLNSVSDLFQKPGCPARSMGEANIFAVLPSRQSESLWCGVGEEAFVIVLCGS